jgi:long-chain acyl-CoA synthetase
VAATERIDSPATGRTVNDLFMQTAADHADAPALVHKRDGAWRTITWGEYRDRAAEVAMALRRLGVGRGDHVALMMRNRPEHVIADVGVLLAGGTPISVYNTLAPEQLQYVASDSSAKVAVVEAGEFLDKWRAVRDQLPALEHIVVLDAPDGLGESEQRWEDLLAAGAAALAESPDEFEDTWRSAEPSDAATVIYTSGTTGPPKGVVLTHGNLMFQKDALAQVLEVEYGLRGVSYLPLAHIAERMTTHYRGIQGAGTTYFAMEVADLLETMLHARPQLLMAVPRVWEKLQAGLMAKIQATEDDRKRALALKAIDVGKRYVETRERGERPGLGLTLQHKLFDKLVFSKIRDGVGLDQLKYAISGAAAISPDLLRFFAGLGIEILEVYGMTESTAVISANQPGRVRFGTVGEVVPGTEMRIADDGEVVFRGGHMTPGYLNREDATAEAIDDEGWFHTGDLGEIDGDGYLRIIGRKKELIITSSGKNLSPNNIEETVKQRSPIIGQVCAVGDDKPYISALVVLDQEALPAWAAAQGIDVSSTAELADHPAVEAEIERAIDEGNQQLARVEQIKQWAILPTEWTAESEELTPTLKLKRSVIHSKYQDVIDGLYSSDSR